MSASDIVMLKGVVHGNTIVPESSAGLQDGQEVTVSVQQVAPVANPNPPSKKVTAAGSWADDPEGLDEFLRWVREHRRM